MLERVFWEFPLWLSGNEPDYYPWGCGFNPWPHPVGQGYSIVTSCSVGSRCGLDLALPWPWCKPAAVAPIRPPRQGTSICCRCSSKKKRERVFWWSKDVFHLHGREELRQVILYLLFFQIHGIGLSGSFIIVFIFSLKLIQITCSTVRWKLFLILML